MKFVITDSLLQPNYKVVCAFCNVQIAEVVNGEPTPSYIECYASGNIPIPNFGWLCSTECAEKYELANEVKFARTLEGIIDYYDGNLE